MPLPDTTAETLRTAARAVLPDPELRLDEWSGNVVIPKGNAFAGPYRLSHTPYARRLLQVLSPVHPASRVVAKVASQMLKTQVFINACLGWIHSAPGNIIALEPTDGLAKRLSARISAAIDACDLVADKVAAPRSRDKRNTIDTKEFDGGTLYITTAGSDANLAEIPARYVFADEVNREGYRAGANEGDRLKMAEARQTTFEGMSKFYAVSSPTKTGASKITELFEQGTQEHYHVPCPHCGHLHELVREHFRYDFDPDTDAVTRAWFVCPDCGCEIDEHHKATILADEALGGQARWVPTAQGDGETVSFTLSAYYAPLGSITWRRLAKELIQALAAKARGDNTLMEVYENTREGIDHDPGEVTSTAQELQKRAQAEGMPARIVPDRALVLTMYADTQDDRLEATTTAWGPGMESFVVDHQFLFGDPSVPPETEGSVWQQLDELRRTPFAHAGGTLIRISAYGIDSGGHHTQDVYNYGAGREHLGCVVTKGSSQRNRPIIAGRPTQQDIDWQGRKVADGIKLWALGTDTAKDYVFNRLRMVSGPGAMHWHQSIELDYLEQLLVEKPQVRWHKGRAIREYIKPNGARNEALDCTVGNTAIAHYLGLHKWSDADWRRLRDNLVPRHATPDMFALAEAANAPTALPDPAPAHLKQPQAQDAAHAPEGAGATRPTPEVAPHAPATAAATQAPADQPADANKMIRPVPAPVAPIRPATPPAAPPYMPPPPPAPAARRVLSRGYAR